MRTIPDSETQLAQAAHRAVHVRVRVSDEGATPWVVDLSSHQGKNWILGAAWSCQSDQPVAQATVKLRRAFDWLTIMPGRTSQANQNASGTAADVLVENKLITIETFIGPHDGAVPSGATWTEQFRGRIIDIEAGNADDLEMTINCLDLGCELQDHFIEDEQGPKTGTSWYTTLSWPRNIETVLQDIIDGTMGRSCVAWTVATVKAAGAVVRPVTRNGFIYYTSAGGTTHATTEPTWPQYLGGTVVDGTVTWLCSNRTPIVYLDGASPWALSQPEKDGKLVTKEPLFAVLRRLVESIGWDFRYVWHAGSSTWRLTMFNPNRTVLTSLFTLSQSRVTIGRPKRSIVGVRNRVRVVYGLAPNRTRTVELEQNVASADTYGARFAEITEASNSNVDTQPEAEKLALAVLNDCKKPYWEFSLTCGLYPYPFFGDVGTLPASTKPDRLWEAGKDFVVIGIAHTIEGVKADSTFTCREVDTVDSTVPHHSKKKHARGMARPGNAPYASLAAPGACRVFGYDAVGIAVARLNDVHLTCFDTFTEDRGGDWDASNNRFTAPYTGGYIFVVRVTLDNGAGTGVTAGTVIDTYLTVGGTQKALETMTVSAVKGGAKVQVGLTAYLALTKGDLVRARLYHNDGVNLVTVLGSDNTGIRILRWH